MADLRIDFNNIIGKIKPMHGVGQPPILGTSFEMFRYLCDAGIPYSRLHDVGGPYGGFRWVDIPNIFRDFDADETKAESYDFAFTDRLITALIEAGIEPVYRLGVTIENDVDIKTYRIDPPKDYNKWARICEHIIRHYTEGWADGFNYKITYWEIWNEPDNFEEPKKNPMWSGTPEEFYEFYDVAAKHLKKCFPHLKFGGYACCGFYDIINAEHVKDAFSSPRHRYFIEFFDGFLDYIKKNGSPLDFFSWHSYGADKDNIIYANYVRRRLDEAGYTNTETTCNEWNREATTAGTFRHAAKVSAVMLIFQKTPLDSAMFYDARCGGGNYPSGMFDPAAKKPYPAYYSFIAFNELYSLKNEAAIGGVLDDDVYAVAASDGKRGALVITNISDKEIPLNIDTDAKIFECRITSEGECDRKCTMPKVLQKDSTLTVRYEL